MHQTQWLPCACSTVASRIFGKLLTPVPTSFEEAEMGKDVSDLEISGRTDLRVRLQQSAENSLWAGIDQNHRLPEGTWM